MPLGASKCRGKTRLNSDLASDRGVLFGAESELETSTLMHG